MILILFGTYLLIQNSVLKSFNVDQDKMKILFERKFQQWVNNTNKRPLTKNAEQLLDNTVEMYIKSDKKIIGTEDLFYSMLSLPETTAYEMITKDLNLNPEQLKEKIDEELYGL